MEDGLHSGQHSIEFTEKRWYESALDFLRFLPGEAPTFAALVVSLWAISEVVMAAAGNRVPVATLAASVLAIAAMAAGLKAYGRFRRYVPKTLQPESSQVQHIFRKQRCGWQLALTRQMLIDRIARSEIELDRVSRGAAFVYPRHLSGWEYFSWLTSRPEAIQRLVHSVAALCTQDLPAVVAGVRDEGALGRLQVEVDALAALYEHAKNFEIECHEIVPPEPFDDVHKMTHGWTQTIRNGVEEFLRVLSQLASLDPKAIEAGEIQLPSFNIVFEAPDNLDEFCRKLDLIEASTVLENEHAW
jgi:hypothetical protein